MSWVPSCACGDHKRYCTSKMSQLGVVFPTLQRQTGAPSPATAGPSSSRSRRREARRPQQQRQRQRASSSLWSSSSSRNSSGSRSRRPPMAALQKLWSRCSRIAPTPRSRQRWQPSPRSKHSRGVPVCFRFPCCKHNITAQCRADRMQDRGYCGQGLKAAAAAWGCISSSSRTCRHVKKGEKEWPRLLMPGGCLGRRQAAAREEHAGGKRWGTK